MNTQNWTTPILKQINEAKAEEQKYKEEASQLYILANQYLTEKKFEMWQNTLVEAGESDHAAYLAKYKWKSLQRDMDYDLGVYDDVTSDLDIPDGDDDNDE